MKSASPQPGGNERPWQVWVSGALIGAVVGVVAAHVLWQQAQEGPEQASAPRFDARLGLRLALIVLKTLRQISSLAGG